MPQSEPMIVEPFEPWKEHPDRGVVTIRELTDKIYERIEVFPDGSCRCKYFGDTSDFVPDETDRGGRTCIGADAAARKLAEAQAGKLIFCHETQAWFAWDGAIWRRDRAGVVARAIRETLREAGDDSGHVALVDACARSEEALSATEAWDADPDRLGTPGGTVDLASGALLPAAPGDRISRATAVAPAATADCPVWRRFVDETTGGDQALVDFLQRFLGYTLTGETSEHVLLFGLGEGGNGKSVLVNTVRGLLGDYAMVAAPDLVTRGGRMVGRAHSAEVAMLAGARLVTAGEAEEGRVWLDGRLKMLTGGEPVTARRSHGDFFTFTPRFKLIVTGNHMPVLRAVDAAMRRRLCVVPFATRPAVPDRTLETRLKAEWPAILRWMIEGGLAWREQGLGRPDSVRAASETYLCGQDIFAQFLDERCETSREARGLHFEATAGALYAAWCAYAKAAGEAPGTQRRFAALLERRGFARERRMHARLYRGLRLLQPEERQ